MTSGIGEKFARAMTTKDAAALLAVLDPNVDFRAMTPGRVWEASSASEVVDNIILGAWFGGNDHIEGLERVDEDLVVDRHAMNYRFRITNDDGTSLVEQHAYFDVTGGRISWMRVVCSGFRRLPTA